MSMNVDDHGGIFTHWPQHFEAPEIFYTHEGVFVVGLSLLGSTSMFELFRVAEGETSSQTIGKE